MINVAVNYSSELKAVIDELISEDKLEGVTLAAVTEPVQAKDETKFMVEEDTMPQDKEDTKDGAKDGANAVAYAKDGVNTKNGAKDGANADHDSPGKPAKQPEQNIPPKSLSGEKAHLIHKFAKIFDAMTLSDLKLLEKTIVDKKDISEFEGLLGSLTDDGKEGGGEDVYSMLDQLKNHYQLLHGILRGQISRKERLNPVSISPETSAPPSKEPPSQSNGQSSSQNGVKPHLEGDVEKLLERRLLAAMKILPVEDLKRIRDSLAQGNDPSAIPELSNELINVAVKYPSELKAVIDELIFEDKLEGVTLAAATEPVQAKDETNFMVEEDTMPQDKEEIENPINIGSQQEEV